MPIRYYGGVEGSGKTAMMSRDLLWHHHAGGKVLTFPGYDLFDRKKQISDVLLPEQWVTLPDELKRNRIAIGIDEVTNFFNNHVWYNKMCDMMAGLMAQRRKFEMAILMTGPVFYRLPPNIREMIHEVIHCTDRHTLNHDIPRGEQCIYYKEDKRGLLSTPRKRFTRKKIFRTRPYWDNYDTYQSVDLINQFITVKFKNRQIVVGADGKVLNPDADIVTSDPATLSRYVNDYKNSQQNQLEQEVLRFLKELKGNNVDRIPRDTVWQYFKAETKTIKDRIGSVLKRYGATHDERNKAYRLNNIAIEG